MEYPIQMSISASKRRTRYTQFSLDDAGISLGDRKIGWHEVGSIRKMPWTLFLRDGSMLSLDEGRLKRLSIVTSFIDDATRRIDQWNQQVPPDQRIERDIGRELGHVTRQLIGMSICGLLAFAMLVTMFMIAAPVSGLIYLMVIALNLFALYYVATMVDKRLTLLALRRDAERSSNASSST